MVLFKIYGERNSGTTFLTNLLEINKFLVNVHDVKNYKGYTIITCWKHGIPINLAKTKDDCVVDIFIFRDLHSWLISMFHNQYHLEKIHDFKRFLSIKVFIYYNGSI